MVGAEHRAQVADALAAAGDALLVEVVAEHVDAVRAGQVVEPVAVEIGDGHAGGGLDEGAGLEVLAHEAAELERHAVAGGELQIGDAVDDRGGRLRGLAAARGEARREAHEARAPRRRDLLGRRVGAKELRPRRTRRTAPGRRSGAPCASARSSERCLARESCSRSCNLRSSNASTQAPSSIARCIDVDHGIPRRALYCRRMTLR